MLIDFAITNYKSIKDTVHLNMVYNTLKTNEELDKICNYDNYIDFFKVPTGNGDNHINVCPVMALFGANASGKSNILKAFLAMRDIFINGGVENFYTPFRFATDKEKAPTNFEITFSNSKENCIYSYGITYTARRIEREYLVKIGETTDKILFDTDDFALIPRDMWQLFITRRKPIANIFFDLKYKGKFFNTEQENGLYAVNNFFNNLFVADDINLTQISEDSLDTVKDWLLRMDMRFCNIEMTSEKDKQKRVGGRTDLFLLKEDKFFEIGAQAVTSIESIDEFKKELEIEHPNSLIVFEFFDQVPGFRIYNINMQYSKDDGREIVPVNYIKDESTGTKNLFRFLFVLIDALQHGKIIIFDEIDRTIHTELIKFLFGIMQAKNLNAHGAQMICSSHNPCIIQTAGRQGTMFVDRNRDLSTSIEFLSAYQYEKNSDILRDYLNNRFGGTPRVVDVFENMEVPNANK